MNPRKAATIFISMWSLLACLSSGQVCSPAGLLCTKTTDCCKGCCEAHTCVDRNFSCSNDLVQQPGSSSCVGYYCPANHICFLKEVCPPENPCPSKPFCRKVDTIDNHSSSEGYHHNSNPRVTTTSGPIMFYFGVILITSMAIELFIL